MRKNYLFVVLMAAFAFSALAQQSGPPRFEVASIRQVDYKPPTPDDLRAGQASLPRLRIENDRVDVTAMPMRVILGNAYGVAGIYIFGESWLESVRWDIHAKIPEGAGKEQASPMLRALLEERFALQSHRETRDMPVYALVEAKGGIKLPELPADTPFSSRTDPATGRMEMTGPLDSIGVAGISAGLNAPVENLTGLTGKYKVSLDLRLMFARLQQLKPGESVAPGADDSDAADRMSEMLTPMGLKLERRKVPKEVVVIDHMNKMPAKN